VTTVNVQLTERKRLSNRR